jgi:hypothetical protein
MQKKTIYLMRKSDEIMCLLLKNWYERVYLYNENVNTAGTMIQSCSVTVLLFDSSYNSVDEWGIFYLIVETKLLFYTYSAKKSILKDLNYLKLFFPSTPKCISSVLALTQMTQQLTLRKLLLTLL